MPLTSPHRFAALLAIATLVALAGCGGDSRTPAPDSTPADDVFRPILVVGADGLEWSVVLPLLQEGRLPTIRRLMEAGRYGYLETFEPTESPAIWTSIATGKVPEKHGILDFIRTDPKGRQTLYDSLDRETKAVWNILGDYGKRSCVIGWWMTHPVEPVNGIMVAQTNTRGQIVRGMYKGGLVAGVEGQVYPPDREPEVMDLAATVEKNLPGRLQKFLGRPPHPLGDLEQRLLDNCMWAFRADAVYDRLSRYFLRREEPFDLTLVYLGGTDVLGHRFWRYREPELYRDPPTAEQVENLGTILADYYVFVDEMLARLLEVAPENVTVLLVSDHGMEPSNLDGAFPADAPAKKAGSALHEEGQPGVIVAAGPMIDAGPPGVSIETLTLATLETIGSVFDITPTILFLEGIPVGEDMDGVILPGARRGAATPDDAAELETHDTGEYLALRREARDSAAKPWEEERLDQLRSLGYID